MKRSTIGLLTALATWLIPALAAADVSFTTRVFSNNMVLQRQMPDPIWGKASPGEQVTVSTAAANPAACFNVTPTGVVNQVKVTTADANGDWRLTLDPMEAGGPYVLTVAGTNTLVVNCMMVGEVWLAAGQSNMAINIPKPPTRKPYTVDGAGGGTLGDVRTFKTRSWADKPAGTAFYFAAELSHTLGVTVGLLNEASGGTAIQLWIAPEVANDPDPTVAALLPTLNNVGLLYGLFVDPLKTYAIRGNIWWQGEADYTRPNSYSHLLPALIRSWRAAWGQGDFPFYFVQLPNGGGLTFDPGVPSPLPKDPPTQDQLPVMANAFFQTLSLPNTGMVITNDFPRTLHPHDKKPYGLRFADLAFANVYGQSSVNYSGPVLEWVLREGSTLRLHFLDNTAVGLYALGSMGSNFVQGFTIAGDDQVYVWATAEIQGNEIVVSDTQVPPVVTVPSYVRYGWSDHPTWANLFNGAGANRGAAIFQAQFVPHVSPTPTPTDTPTPTTTPTPTITPTFTLTPTITPTPTITATFTITSTPSLTASPTITGTPTQTFTPSMTASPTMTFTPSLTATITDTPTVTPTETSTPSPTETPVPICTSTIPITVAAMKVFHNFTPAGQQNFRLSGYVQLPASAQPVNPMVDGFTFYVTDGLQHQALIQRQLPPGLLWRQSINKRLWTYADPNATVSDVKKVSIISIPLKGPNYYKVSVIAPKGNFLLPTNELPLTAIFVMGGPAQAQEGLCAMQVLNPPTGPPPLCHAIGSILVCK